MNSRPTLRGGPAAFLCLLIGPSSEEDGPFPSRAPEARAATDPTAKRQLTPNLPAVGEDSTPLRTLANLPPQSDSLQPRSVGVPGQPPDLGEFATAGGGSQPRSVGVPGQSTDLGEFATAGGGSQPRSGGVAVKGSVGPWRIATVGGWLGAKIWLRSGGLAGCRNSGDPPRSGGSRGEGLAALRGRIGRLSDLGQFAIVWRWFAAKICLRYGDGSRRRRTLVNLPSFSGGLRPRFAMAARWWTGWRPG